MKRLLSHHNKEKMKQNVGKNEYAKRNRLTDFEILTFSFDFTLSSKSGVSSWNFLNHFCVYSCLVPTNMLT